MTSRERTSTIRPGTSELMPATREMSSGVRAVINGPTRGRAIVAAGKPETTTCSWARTPCRAVPLQSSASSV